MTQYLFFGWVALALGFGAYLIYRLSTDKPSGWQVLGYLWSHEVERTTETDDQGNVTVIERSRIGDLDLQKKLVVPARKP